MLSAGDRAAAGQGQTSLCRGAPFRPLPGVRVEKGHRDARDARQARPRGRARPHPRAARLVATSTVFTSSTPLPSAAVSGVVTTTTSSMCTLTSGVAMVPLKRAPRTESLHEGPESWRVRQGRAQG